MATSHGIALDTVLVGQAPPPFGPAGILLAETLEGRRSVSLMC